MSVVLVVVIVLFPFSPLLFVVSDRRAGKRRGESFREFWQIGDGPYDRRTR